MKKRYYYQMVIKYKREPQLNAALAKILTKLKPALKMGFKLLSILNRNHSCKSNRGMSAEKIVYLTWRNL
ncbi:hypothetical protein [Lacticaseibacillus manihotivorans]|uniref:hypothetical protein n=1 Tax=Lacticaseibacillus manihotivorans TaxID=88233 RepID=UPI000AF87A75|nr:hypothetical protein [Lacticaseibacillus manihotivorans]